MKTHDPASPIAVLSRPAVTFAWLLAAGVVLLAVSLGIGRYPLEMGDVLALISASLGGPAHGRDPALEQVFWQLRLPRSLAALLVGAALAVSGACLQRAFRNPLAAPELLGVSAGSALGAALAIVAGAGVMALQWSAFAGGLAAITVVLAVGPLLPNRDRLLGLILTGVVVSSLAGALLAALVAFRIRGRRCRRSVTGCWGVSQPSIPMRLPDSHSR